MVGMTVLRDYDQYTFAHSVNVAIFSIALGKKLGLSKIELCDLGMGALLHDIGKSRTPIELVTKAGQLEEPEWEILREHPTEGLLALLEMRGAGEVPFRAMLNAYEHHMKVDQTGYPQSKREREPTLYSRIVAIADGFDAATTRRSYQATPWLPDAVLREMRDNPDRGFDPLLVKAFISMTGIYPVGSVVVLDTFELAVVVSTNQETPSRPQVKVIFDELGIPVSPSRTLDLSQVDPETGAPLRTVVKATDPERYGINIKDYFA
jgi:putative nucleotidyltransferase with HDIG domain